MKTNEEVEEMEQERSGKMVRNCKTKDICQREGVFKRVCEKGTEKEREKIENKSKQMNKCLLLTSNFSSIYVFTFYFI